jgi:hypothetical protein
MSISATVLKVIPPVLCVVVLITLKPLLRTLAPIVQDHHRQRYLQNVAALGAHSNISAWSQLSLVFAIGTSILVWIYTKEWLGELSMIASAVAGIAVLYGYLFAYVWFKSCRGSIEAVEPDKPWWSID